MRAKRAQAAESLEFGSARELEAAARGALTKITPRKRRLIRALEIVLLPLVRAVDWVRRAEASGEPGPIRKILIVEYWQMGDAILVLPFLKNLRRDYPRARIVWLANPRVVPLVESQDLVDEFVAVQVPWTNFSRWRKYNPFSLLWLKLAWTVLLLRRQRFDMALTGRMDIRDNFLAWLINARQRIGYGVGGGGFLLTNVAIPDLEHPHRSYCWLRLLEHLGKPVLETQPRLRISQAQKDFAGDFLAGQGIRRGELVIGVHAGARIATRQWGKQNFLAVARQLASEFPVRILWFEDPGESAGEAGPEGSVVHVSLPLDGFLAVLAHCQLLICNDSGPMHMAEALGVPVVAVFGPTQVEWFGPRGEGDQVVYRPEFWCRPCFEYCIFDQPYCLRRVSADQVFEAAAKVVGDLSVGAPLSARERGKRAVRAV